MGNSGNFHQSCTQCNIRENGRWFNCGCWTKLPKGTVQWDDIKNRLKRTTIDLSKMPSPSYSRMYADRYIQMLPSEPKTATCTVTETGGSRTFAAEDLRMILSQSSAMTKVWRRTAGSREDDGVWVFAYYSSLHSFEIHFRYHCPFSGLF